MSWFFTFDGKPSTDFGTYIATSNMFDSPKRDIESVAVPGKSGELTLDNGRFKNFTGKLDAYCPYNMRRNIDGLREFLGSRVGYHRYTDNMHPEEFRMARFIDAFELDKSDRVGASIKLKFDLMPQRWLLAGEEPITFPSSGNIYNPTLYAARPLIRAYGTGTFSIGGVSVQIRAANVYTDIDCELMDAFKGSINCNGNIVLQGGKFPTIAPGLNAITKTGITSLIITPRWWRL